MKTRLFRLILIAFIVCAATDVVRANLFPSVFSFSNSAMNAVFLLPFRLAGC